MGWYDRLYRLYWTTPRKIDEKGLTNAVTRGWITQEEKDQIINNPPTEERKA